MSKCVGIEGNACGKEFYDPQFPNDTLCDQCYGEMEEGNE